jgi:8-oxo-dGTP diphosphatase
MNVTSAQIRSYQLPVTICRYAKQSQNKPNQTQYLAPNFMLGVLFYDLKRTICLMAQKGKYVYDWPRPTVSVDIAVFKFSDGKTELLLIRRKNEPFKGKWALPGGFVDIDEELEDAAARELAEETGLKNIPLEQLRTFGEIGRDPRGRQITIVFTGIAKSGQDKIKAGDDAAEARWFEVEKLPKDLAFDHSKITRFVIEKLKR